MSRTAIPAAGNEHWRENVVPLSCDSSRNGPRRSAVNGAARIIRVLSSGGYVVPTRFDDRRLQVQSACGVRRLLPQASLTLRGLYSASSHLDLDYILTHIIPKHMQA